MVATQSISRMSMDVGQWWQMLTNNIDRDFHMETPHFKGVASSGFIDGAIHGQLRDSVCYRC